METKKVFYISFAAALIGFVCALFMGFCLLTTPRINHEPRINLQPSYPIGTMPDFRRPIVEHPELVLRFFTADSLFVLSYLVVFVGLFTVVIGRSRTLAYVGLGAGVLAALLDAIENSFFITYAWMVLKNYPSVEPALPLIYIVANLKLMGTFAAFLVFGLVWPRDEWLGWVVSSLMLVFVLIGVLGIYFPCLFQIGASFFLPGMLLFAWYFWKEARKI